MQLVDRIEKRRFVGRELLLWLWFESELFEGTLSTKEHGEFGLWIERQLTISSGKEVTRIKGGYPAGSREAKEALLLGKLPEVFGMHLSWRERECNFVLKAETLALAGLSLPTVLGAEDAPAELLDRPTPKKKRKAESPDPSDAQHEVFYERMMLAREVEGLVEALYRDFLVLRLGPTWDTLVAPALKAWSRGEDGVDADDYRKVRDAALGKKRR